MLSSQDTVALGATFLYPKAQSLAFTTANFLCRKRFKVWLTKSVAAGLPCQQRFPFLDFRCICGRNSPPFQAIGVKWGIQGSVSCSLLCKRWSDIIIQQWVLKHCAPPSSHCLRSARSSRISDHKDGEEWPTDPSRNISHQGRPLPPLFFTQDNVGL